MTLPRPPDSLGRRRRRALAAAIAILLVFGCRPTSPSPAAQLDALFSDLHERGLFSGAVVVSDPQGVVFAKGYGFANVEAQAAFTPDTPADGGSLAKTFTAALLLALEAEGQLSLDDPAQKLLPELPYPEIKLRDLLRHTSGLLTTDYEWFASFLGQDEVRTTERLLRVIAEQQPALHARPGTAFEYSSFAYDLALLAASRAAGEASTELLAERIFRPLAMTSAFARPGRFRDFPEPRTLGYQEREGSRRLRSRGISRWLEPLPVGARPRSMEPLVLRPAHPLSGRARQGARARSDRQRDVRSHLGKLVSQSRGNRVLVLRTPRGLS